MTKVFPSDDIWNEREIERKKREYTHICRHEIIEFVGVGVGLSKYPRCLHCGIEFDDYGNPILERE